MPKTHITFTSRDEVKVRYSHIGGLKVAMIGDEPGSMYVSFVGDGGKLLEVADKLRELAEKIYGYSLISEGDATEWVAHNLTPVEVFGAPER